MKVVELMGRALKEISVEHALFATLLLNETVTAVLSAEQVLDRMVGNNAAQRAFVGAGREEIYKNLFTNKGVTKATADELVAELITLH